MNLSSRLQIVYLDLFPNVKYFTSLQVLDPCSVLALELPLHPDLWVLVRFIELDSHGKPSIIKA